MTPGTKAVLSDLQSKAIPYGLFAAASARIADTSCSRRARFYLGTRCVDVNFVLNRSC